jgi:hypothetical protein
VLDKMRRRWICSMHCACRGLKLAFDWALETN